MATAAHKHTYHDMITEVLQNHVSVQEGVGERAGAGAERGERRRAARFAFFCTLTRSLLLPPLPAPGPSPAPTPPPGA